MVASPKKKLTDPKMLPRKSIHRYRLLITPVITTKPASSDLIIRAPTEKIIEVKTWLRVPFLVPFLKMHLPETFLGGFSEC